VPAVGSTLTAASAGRSRCRRAGGEPAPRRGWGRELAGRGGGTAGI